MTDLVYTVGIVVDTHFGNRIKQLAQKMPVWVVDTPENRAATEQLWKEKPVRTHLEEITTFKVDPSGSPQDWCNDILQTVDLHHGEYSHDPPYSSVVVFGVKLNAELQVTFERYGFREFIVESQGFRALSKNTSS